MSLGPGLPHLSPLSHTRAFAFLSTVFTKSARTLPENHQENTLFTDFSDFLGRSLVIITRVLGEINNDYWVKTNGSNGEKAE